MLVVGVIILKKTWYDRLDDSPSDKNNDENLIFNDSKSDPNYG